MSVNYKEPFDNLETSSVVLSELSILYVSENSVLREKLADFLKSVFKEVQIASCGEEGLNKFTQSHEKEKTFNIVLTDALLKNVSGLDMLEQIKDISSDISCVLIADYYDSDSILHAIHTDINHFVIKPIKINRLVHTLKKSYLVKHYKNMLLSK